MQGESEHPTENKMTKKTRFPVPWGRGRESRKGGKKGGGFLVVAGDGEMC